MTQRDLFQTDKKTKVRGKPNGPYTKQFESWWKVYNRKVEKRKAFGAFLKALEWIEFDLLMEYTKELMETDKAKGQFCPYPATFLNNQRWDDDPKCWQDKDQEGPY